MEFLPDKLHVGTLSSALTILSSMITPALLLSASGTFVLSTSNRQNRVVDRVRNLTEQFEEAVELHKHNLLFDERRTVLYSHIDMLTRRADLLQQTLTALFIASGLFVATSVAIGLISLTDMNLGWLPVVLGLFGASCLFYAAVLLIMDARLAIQLLRDETAYLLKLVRASTADAAKSSVLGEPG